MVFHEFRCDTGVIQHDSLHLDAPETIRRARAFHSSTGRRVRAEADFLTAAGARLVVGDIPPLAFGAARAAGLPSIAIGNFTWDWIYEGYPEESPSRLCADIRELYGAATRALRLPMSGGFDGLEGITTDIPFIARQSTRTRADVRAAVLGSRADGSKPLVLISFGGYGVAGMETASLARLDAYTICTTDLPARDHAVGPAPGLLHLSEQDLYGNGYRYEDLVRAADVVVTKPGYGIISEAIANDAALLYTSRGRFVEYDVLVREMPRFLRSQFISQERLLTGHWAPALEQLLALPPPPERPPLNGAVVAAEAILELAG
jgi:L-arabinokinase